LTIWLLQNQEGSNLPIYRPQQVEVVVEMARAMEDGRLTPPETQSITNAGLAFGLSLIFITILGVLMRSIVADTLEPKQEEVVQPVIDFLLPASHSIPRDDLKLIAEKYGWWAARQAEALCPHNDVACVEREAKRLYEVVKQRMAA